MMNRRFTLCPVAAALALVGALTSVPARADLVVLGADYLQTIQPTFFTPLGPLNPLAGLAIGPGLTDTIVHRQANCALNLASASSCTIPIELVALSLISTVNPNVRLRESPSLPSSGNMTISSDGSGSGGTFDSFFDIFFEVSLDGGGSWAPQGPLPLVSFGTAWTTIEDPQHLFVDGLLGDQNANRHTNKGTDCPPTAAGPQSCVDFYLVGSVTEQHGLGVHTAQPTPGVPEPGTLALIGLALAGLGAMGAARRNARHGDGQSANRRSPIPAMPR